MADERRMWWVYAKEKKRMEKGREAKKRTRYYLLNNFRTCDRPSAL